jgi:hypothetical protein
MGLDPGRCGSDLAPPQLPVQLEGLGDDGNRLVRAEHVVDDALLVLERLVGYPLSRLGDRAITIGRSGYRDWAIGAIAIELLSY